MIGILSFFIMLLVLVSWARPGADFLSPARLILFVWSLAIGLADLKLSALQHEWTAESWLLVLLGPASLILGLYSTYVLNVNAPLHSLGSMRNSVRSEEVDGKILFQLIVLAFLVYASAFLISYAAKGFVPIFSGRYGARRTEFSVFGIGVLLHSMPFIVFFSLVYHIMVKESKGRKLIVKLIAIVSAITYLFLLQRFLFILTAVTGFAFLYYVTHRMRLRTILTSLAVGVVLFYSVSSLRAGQLVQLYLYASSKMKYSKEYAVFTEPYMYIVMNLENLARAVQRVEYFTFGYYTFDFITALSGVKHWIADYFILQETPYLNSSYNTYTAFWTYYRDFGVVGLFLIPLVLGMLVGSAYYSMRKDPTIEKVSLYGVMVFVLLISFFNSPIGFLVFVYVLVSMVLILKLIKRRDLMSLR